MTDIITVASIKGGVGKTTTVLNLGVALQRLGKRVLLIDLDPQSNLTRALGCNPLALERTIYTAIEAYRIRRVHTLQDTIVATSEIDLVPANIDLSLSANDLVNTLNREHILKTILRPVIGAYDYVFIDTHPSIGLLTTNALVTSTHVIISIEAETFAVSSLPLTLQNIKEVKVDVNPDLQVMGIVFTKVDSRKNIVKQAIQSVEKRYGSDFKIFASRIPDSVRFSESQAEQKSIFMYDHNGSGAVAYNALAMEILNG